MGPDAEIRGIRSCMSSADHDAHRQLAKLAKLRQFTSGMASGAHLRYRLANAAARPFPEFMAGFVLSRLYRAAGFHNVGRNAFISAPMRLTGNSSNIYQNLIIADGANISTDVTVNLDARVSIGPGATLSPYVRIYTATHRHGGTEQRCHPDVRSRPVTIEQGCWIGLGAIITPGVVVGRGSVVGAGAVLSRSVPPNSFVSGNPASVLGRLPETADWMGPRPLRDTGRKPAEPPT